MIEVGPVGSLAAFFKAVKAMTGSWQEAAGSEWMPWFRGEDNADWPTALQPRLYRVSDTRHLRVSYVLHCDQELRLEFQRRGAQLVPGFRAPDKWEWYFLMQHYGVPTRLLDWTDGALVALYFAVKCRGGRKDAHGKADAAVYVLDPWWLNERAFEGLKDPPSGVALPDWAQVQKYLPKELDSESLRPGVPVAIDPTYLSSRLAAQRAWFTIFGRHRNGLVHVARGKGGRLCRIRIAARAVRRLQRGLKASGVSEFTVFPDLDGLGRELGSWWEEQTTGASR